MAVCDELLLEIETKNEPVVMFTCPLVIVNLSVLGEEEEFNVDEIRDVEVTLTVIFEAELSTIPSLLWVFG